MTTALEPTEPEVSLDWQERAACRTNRDPDLFFPHRSDGNANRKTEQAKDVCKGCDVRRDCLLYALRTGQQWGVWGGLSEQELRAIRKKAAGQREDRDGTSAPSARARSKAAAERQPPSPARATVPTP
jgi:WhiB family redox-sensing transcriptional regulator